MFPSIPHSWKIPAPVLAGVAAGLCLLGARLFNAKALLSNASNGCINCHVMTTQYAGWERSSHARVATCSDCHLPHSNLARKYAAKTRDGLHDLTYYVLGMESQTYSLSPRSQAIVQHNCLRCHDSQLELFEEYNKDRMASWKSTGHPCWKCHRNTPHGRRASQAAGRSMAVPPLPPLIPDWLEKYSSAQEEAPR